MRVYDPGLGGVVRSCPGASRGPSGAVGWSFSSVRSGETEQHVEERGAFTSTGPGRFLAKGEKDQTPSGL